MKVFMCNVKCDNSECDFVVENVNFYEYLNKKCSKCGTVLLNNGDLRVADAIRVLCNAGIVVNRTGAEDTSNSIKIDTAPLHQENTNG